MRLLTTTLLLCCWVLALGAHATARTEQLEQARRALRSDDDRERQEAVQELAKLGSEEAWEVVLGVLNDPEPRVADEAQLVLAQASADHDELLLGRLGLGSKRGTTALRVAEALGRRETQLSAAAWEKALRHKDAEVRRSLLWSLERLGEEPLDDGTSVVALLEKLVVRDKDELARAHAWLALAAVAPEQAASGMQVRCRDKSAAARAACAERIELAPADRQLEWLTLLVADDVRVVRLRAYEALARRGDRAGALALAVALEAEAATRMSWRLVELLQDLSGQKTGRNSRAWRAWAQALPEDWAPGRGTGEREYDERTVAFVGMPVLSDRVAFLVDLSGSMWQEREGGTRKQALDQEFARVLGALPEEAHFNLVPFVERPQLWQKSLTRASKKSVAKALAFFEGNKSQGKGNYWDALMLAMEDPEVDTLMVLGDGAPSGGTRWNLILIEPLFAHENRFRGIFVDALLIDTKGRLRRSWEELCTSSGGRALVVDL